MMETEIGIDIETEIEIEKEIGDGEEEEIEEVDQEVGIEIEEREAEVVTEGRKIAGEDQAPDLETNEAGADTRLSKLHDIGSATGSGYTLYNNKGLRC